LLWQVDSPDQVLAILKAIPPEVLEAKLKLMHEYGTRFSFLKRLTTPPNAVNRCPFFLDSQQQDLDHLVLITLVLAIHEVDCTPPPQCT